MLPEKFTNRMKALLGTEYQSFEDAVSRPPERAFRINTNKISTEEFLKINPFGGTEIPFAENGYYFSFDGIGNQPYHHAGMVYVQEPAAMSVVSGINIKPDWKILDLCAAPGGKSTQAASFLGENGLIVSNEIIPSRCKILTGNMERMGFRNAVTTCADTKRLSSLFGEEFDLVIVDAPCSGEGMFRKSCNAVNDWSEENVVLCAKRQREILGEINTAVREGGYLLYSTCTFSPEENEMTVDDFLSGHPEFKLVPVSDSVISATADGIFFDGCRSENIHYCRRFYPHISKGEGQFMALMQKTYGKGLSIKRENALEKLNKPESRIVYDFLDSTLVSYDRSCVKKHKDNIVYFAPDFIVPKGIAFSCGVTIGTVKKNYIQPHHQFFTAMGKDFIRQLTVTEEEAEEYIKGNTLPCSIDNGWAAVTLKGCTLGGAKIVKGTAKNHYPKGLRKQ